jgi:hypothetical protein
VSYCLYMSRSWPIVNQRQHTQLNILFSYFYPSFLVSFSFSSIRSIRHRFNLQSCHGSRLSIVQTLLGQRRSTSSQPDSAPGYRRSRQNRGVQFLKPNCLISIVRARAFGPYSFCVATHFSTLLGNRLLQACQA